MASFRFLANKVKHYTWTLAFHKDKFGLPRCTACIPIHFKYRFIRIFSISSTETDSIEEVVCGIDVCLADIVNGRIVTC